MRDLRDAFRSARRHPFFTMLVVSMLALGVGGATAVFSAVRGILIAPLPYDRPNDLVWMFGAFRLNDSAAVSPPDFVDYRASNGVFASLGAMVIAPRPVTVAGGREPVRLSAATVSAGLIGTLGVEPLLGRDFRAGEEQSSAGPAVVISERLWRERFHGSPGVLGAPMRVDDEVRTIVGVMPSGFALPFDPFIRLTDPVDVYLPLALDDQENQVRRFHFLRLIGRLRAGVSVAAAQAQMDTVARQLEGAYPENETWKLRLLPLHERMVGDLRRVLLVLLGAVLLLLLVACANVGGLLLTRGVIRRSEIAVRAALGASRGRIVRLMLLESAVLGTAGAAAGILVGAWLVQGMKALGPPDLPRLAEIRVDAFVIACSALVAVLASTVFGVAPAVYATRTDASDTLRPGTRAIGGRGSTRLRTILVTAQVAVSCTLLVAAGLLIQSLWRLQSVDPGFVARGVVSSQLSLPADAFDTDQKMLTWYDALLERLAGAPGVESAALASAPPLVGANDTAVHREGRAPASDKDRRFAQVRVVTGDYFDALRIPVVTGRTFTRADRPGARAVMLISRRMAQEFFPFEGAIGQRLVVDRGEPLLTEVVGVVGDARLFGQAVDAPATMYLAAGQFPSPTTHVVIRFAGDDEAGGAVLRQVVRSLGVPVPVGRVEAIQGLLDRSIAQPRFRTVLVVLFAGVALLLTLGGLYGTLSWAVAQRTREFGVRVALGARPRQLSSMVFRDGARMVGPGSLLGLAGASLAGRVVRDLLYDPRPFEPGVFAAVTLGVVGLALVAMLGPARRAGRIDPAVTLRAE